MSDDLSRFDEVAGENWKSGGVEEGTGCWWVDAENGDTKFPIAKVYRKKHLEAILAVPDLLAEVKRLRILLDAATRGAEEEILAREADRDALAEALEALWASWQLYADHDGRVVDRSANMSRESLRQMVRAALARVGRAPDGPA